MIVVSDSSPLITLARIEQLGLLQQLFGRIAIPNEVYHEVVVRGAGRAAASAVQTADWIETHPPADPSVLAELQSRSTLGSGEVATLILAQSLKAELTLIDERIARRAAQARGLSVIGCVGILETSHRLGFVPNLRETYLKMIERGIYIDRQLLNNSLNAANLISIREEEFNKAIESIEGKRAPDASKSG